MEPALDLSEREAAMAAFVKSWPRE
jgi:hypothetical protein